MVSRYNKNKKGFSLVESVVALVIVSITIGSIYFSIQSNILFAKKLNSQISNYFITSNLYSYFVLDHKLLEKKTLEGQNLDHNMYEDWFAKLKPTMIEGINLLEVFTKNQNDNKIKIKTEYYVYSQTDSM